LCGQKGGIFAEWRYNRWPFMTTLLVPGARVAAIRVANVGQLT
jgi:hypothetical protein